MGRGGRGGRKGDPFPFSQWKDITKNFLLNGMRFKFCKPETPPSVKNIYRTSILHPLLSYLKSLASGKIKYSNSAGCSRCARIQMSSEFDIASPMTRR